MRCFLAVYPDADARRALAEVVPEEDGGLRVTDLSDWHVTVRFLGELDDGEVAAVAAAATRAAASVPPCCVRLGPATALGAGGHVLFVPACGLEGLAGALDEELPAALGPRERPFLGHLTIARARGRERLGRFRAGAPCSASFTATELALVASSLEPGRAVHRVLDRFALGAPRST